MNRKILTATMVIVCVTSGRSTAFAGGPLRFNSTGPVVWDTAAPIKYKTDKASLGGISATDAQALVKDAFDVWTGVATARITFQSDGLLPVDVKTAVAYLPYEANSAPNVVVFDTDGDIIADLAGPENRYKIIGWANPLTSSNGTTITKFYSLMNGLFAVNGASFLSTLVHEFGHSVGLDHSQIHAALANNGIATDDKHIPTMFPTNADDDTHLGNLNPDDEAWISMLYPDATFDTKYGKIRGRLKRQGGDVVLGANVVAVQIAADGSSSLTRQFSCVSDWLMKSDGEFLIPVLPGKYKLFVEPILPEFNAGSSVGPWSDSAESPSFENPVELQEFPSQVQVDAGNTKDVGDLIAN